MNVKLSENKTMPIVGFGTYLIGDDDAETLVRQAIDTGYRHIDTAEAYGNEGAVGRGIRSAMKESGITRDELFVTTKLWPGNEAWGQAVKSYEETLESLRSSLERLQLDYVDLYLVHAPFAKDKRVEQWKALIELRRLGLAKAIGVSNFNRAHIEEIEAAGLPLPEADQIELHPWSQKQELVSWLDGKGIQAIAYSSLVPLSSWRTAPGQDSAKTEEMKADGSSSDSPFKKMAGKYNVTEAQLLLRWGIQKGYAVLPKSTKAERMRTNLDLFSFTIDNEDMAFIAKMDRGDGVAWNSGDPSKED